jgi:hypothetical protein
MRELLVRHQQKTTSILSKDIELIDTTKRSETVEKAGRITYAVSC